jgi:hypothetical protein
VTTTLLRPTTGSDPTEPPWTAGLDEDSDGYIQPGDCDDGDADVHPDADEWCNTIDDDCDGVIDEDAVDGSVGFVGRGRRRGRQRCPATRVLHGAWVGAGDGDCDDGDHSRSPLCPTCATASTTTAISRSTTT